MFGLSSLRFLLLPCFFSTVLLAQSATNPAQSSQPGETSAPSVTANADEVALDLVVHTKKGKPVLDLKPGDLAVTDAGQPVTLSDLHLVTNVSGPEHLVTLVFDRLDPGPARAARDLAARILRAIPEQGYSLAVLQMDGRLRILQGYTPNRDAVLKAAEEATAAMTRSGKAAQASPGAEMTPAEKELVAAAQGKTLSADFRDRERSKLLVTSIEEWQRLVEDQHTWPSLAALLAIARSEGQITGRKLIVYFAQGLYADSDSRGTIKSLVGQANRAGVTLCAVDTNALDQQISDKMQVGTVVGSMNVGGAMNSAAQLGRSGMPRGSTDPTPLGMISQNAGMMGRLEFGAMDGATSPLVALASGTGGMYIKAGNGFRRPLEQFHDDLTNYYEAAYVPSIKNYNGEFRPILIRSLRKGLVVRSRAGYFAVPPENGSGIRPFEVPLLSILEKQSLPTDVAFRATVLRLGELPEGNTGSLQVEVPVSELQVHDDATTRLSSVHVSIFCQIKDEEGRVVQRFSEDIPRHQSPDVLRSPPGHFVTMQRHFSAAPGTYTLETAVMDRIGNKAGAQRTQFTIETPPQGPALGDLALVRLVQPIHAEIAPFDPLRFGNGHVVPDLGGVLPEGTKSVSLFFIVHPAAGSAPALALEALRNGEPLGKMPLELSQTGPGALPYLGTIQAQRLPPGNYQLRAILTQNGQTATSSVAFRIEGSIAATNAPTASFTAASGTPESAADPAADERLTSAASVSNSRFKLSSPPNPVAPPSDTEMQDIIEGARQRALAWSDSLPNFFCVEITDRSVDSGGRGEWKHKDTIVQLMRYVDHQESRKTLEIDGKPSSMETSDIEGARSVGEFGGMLRVVFDPSAQAKFAWKESDVLDGQPVQVFGFTVDLAHSNFDLAGDNNRQMPVAFHGLAYLDTATHSVRRITIQADNIPPSFHVHATSISVDYSWIAINNHDYLLPVRGAVSLREGRHQAVLNEFEFREYRRFGAQIRILSKQEAEAATKN